MNGIIAKALADATEPILRQVVVLNTLVVPGEEVPVNERIEAAVNAGLSLLSGVDDYVSVADVRLNMRNEVLRQRANLADQRQEVTEQRLSSQEAINAAQEALLLEVVNTQGQISGRVTELGARLELVKADGQNVALDLAANQAHDNAQDARLAAAETQLAADALALRQLQAHDVATDAALAANAAADQATAAQVASTQAIANQALALGQAEHLTNVAQQTQLDSQAAQQALLAARQTADEQQIAAAQAAATAAQAKADAAATAAAQAQATATAAQTTATSASQAAAAAQASANAAQARADLAEADAQAAKTAATAAQAKATDASAAAAAAQAQATAAQQAAAANATALTALQSAVAGKLDAALVRRGSVPVPAVTIVVANPATVAVAFATPFADANYEVFLSKPGNGLLGVELGPTNKTAAGFTLTERNTGLASLAVPASTADYFAIHN